MPRPRRKKKDGANEKESEAPSSRGLFPLPKSYKRWVLGSKSYDCSPQHEIINTLDFSSKPKLSSII